MFSFDGTEFLPDAAVCDKFDKDTDKNALPRKVSDEFLPHNALVCNSPENQNPTKLETKFKHRLYRILSSLRKSPQNGNNSPLHTINEKTDDQKL